MWLKAGGRSRCPELPTKAPSHAGLGYTRCAPLEVFQGESSDKKSKALQTWLKQVADCAPPEHYPRAYQRWRESFHGPDTVSFLVRARSRLLVGHGTSAATQVGLTLHHTWGVPVLPGSALKGLTAHYVQTVYGPERGLDAPEREPFQGLVWKDGRPVDPPGALFRRLFGAPDVEGVETPSTRGEVLFHDALWVPGPKPMLVRDVLTVHQRSYYEQPEKNWPNDFDAPNPVAFLTVAPEQCFLVVLEAPGARELLEGAARYVGEALESWGLGGKTAAGYGRFVREEAVARTERPPETATLKELKAVLEQQKAEDVPQRRMFEFVEAHWEARLLRLVGQERRGAGHLLKHYIRLKKPDSAEFQRMKVLLERLLESGGNDGR